MKRLFLALFIFTSLFFSISAGEESSYSPYGYQTNFNIFVIDTIDFSTTDFRKNYVSGKFSIDLAEGWFGRLGIYTSVGVEIGGELDNNSIKQSGTTNTIAAITTPELGVSYYFIPKLIGSAGLGFTQTWYKTAETKDGSTDKVHTTRYSGGVAVPLKLRYYFLNNLAVTGVLIPVIQAGSPSETSDGKTKTNIAFSVQFDLGITFSIPSKRL